MITFSYVKENIIEKGVRILKIIQFGVKTAESVSAFGDDSAPLKDMVAIYANTSEVGEKVILGYINKNQIALDGEKRIFSLMPDGSLSFSIHLKNDGTCEINGNADNLVRYQKLDDSLQAQKNLINVELGKIQAAIQGVGGVYLKQDITINTSAAKVDEVKTT